MDSVVFASITALVIKTLQRLPKLALGPTTTDKDPAHKRSNAGWGRRNGWDPTICHQFRCPLINAGLRIKAAEDNIHGLPRLNRGCELDLKVFGF